METINAKKPFAARFKLEIPIHEIITLRPRILNVLAIANALHRQRVDLWPFEMQREYCNKMELMRLKDCLHDYDEDVRKIERTAYYNAVGFTVYMRSGLHEGFCPVVLSTGGLIYINENIDKDCGELGFCAKLVNVYGNTFRNFEQEFFKYTGVTDASQTA